jgi:hypothetical protein
MLWPSNALSFKLREALSPASIPSVTRLLLVIGTPNQIPSIILTIDLALHSQELCNLGGKKELKFVCVVLNEFSSRTLTKHALSDGC